MALTGHHNPGDGGHSSDHNTIDTTLNALSLASGKYSEGTLASRPAAATFGVGYYKATDVNGGTFYHSDASVWSQLSPGITQPSGLMTGPVQLTSTFNVGSVGTTITDVPGMSIAVSASSQPVLLRASLDVIAATGTSANGSSVQVWLFITDNSNTNLALSLTSFTQVGSTNLNLGGQCIVEKYLSAPVASATYKLRAKIGAALPSNWTSVNIIPSYGQIGGASNNFYAVNC